MSQKKKWYVNTEVLGWKLLAASIAMQERSGASDVRLSVGVYDTAVGGPTFGGYLTSKPNNLAESDEARIVCAQEAIADIMERATAGTKFIQPNPQQFFIGFQMNVFGERIWFTCVDTTVVACTGSHETEYDRVLTQVMATFISNKVIHTQKEFQEDGMLREMLGAAWRSLKLSELVPTGKALISPNIGAFKFS